MDSFGFEETCFRYADGRRTVVFRNQTFSSFHGLASTQPVGEFLSSKFPVPAVAYTPDGRTVITATEDGTARCWDTATRRPLGKPIPIPDKLASLQISQGQDPSGPRPGWLGSAVELRRAARRLRPGGNLDRGLDRIDDRLRGVDQAPGPRRLAAASGALEPAGRSPLI